MFSLLIIVYPVSHYFGTFWFRAYGDVLLRLFLSEGAHNGHDLLVAGEGSDQLLTCLPQKIATNAASGLGNKDISISVFLFILKDQKIILFWLFWDSSLNCYSDCVSDPYRYSLYFLMLSFLQLDLLRVHTHKRRSPDRMLQICVSHGDMPRCPRRTMRWVQCSFSLI